jgi:hypothetical protein
MSLVNVYLERELSMTTFLDGDGVFGGQVS